MVGRRGTRLDSKFLFVFLIITFNANVFLNAKDAAENNESELSITVGPGKTECFYQYAKEDDVIEIEYQVLDATFGDIEIRRELNINFFLRSPTNREIISDYMKADAVHRHEVKERGDYKICFDNTNSRFSTKSVYFEIFVDSEEEDRWDNLDVVYPPELIYNDTIEDIKNCMDKVRDNLIKVKHFQDQMRATEARDRNIQEHNFSQVNTFSIIIVSVMLIVGAVQVLMVRSLFEEKSKLHKIFKLLS
ncbi:transmembrane emp24 domain-containing protein 1-like [Tachypleus tridentatus]|uniref:transmembrane emp24 domain-containing protein 1-like n=1 Tax=Tachypleus tridentatus TaxID=6853 RepID=UPI003FD696F0